MHSWKWLTIMHRLRERVDINAKKDKQHIIHSSAHPFLFYLLGCWGKGILWFACVLLAFHFSLWVFRIVSYGQVGRSKMAVSLFVLVGMCVSHITSTRR